MWTEIFWMIIGAGLLWQIAKWYTLRERKKYKVFVKLYENHNRNSRKGK